MKKLIITIAMLTALPMIANDYYYLAKQLNSTKPQTMAAITSENINAVYNACKATNDWTAAQIVAAYGYKLRNNNLYLDWAENAPNDLSKRSVFSAVTACSFIGTNGVTLLDIDPRFSLRLGTKLCERGLLDDAALLFLLRLKMNKTGICLSDDAKSLIESTFTPAATKSLQTPYAYSHVIDYFKMKDYIEGNSSTEPNVAARWDIAQAKKMALANMSECWSFTKRIEYYNIVLQNAPSVSLRIKTANKLDKIYKNKDTSASIWNYVLANGKSNEICSFALYLEDKDKIIDAFKSNLDLNIDAKNMNSLINIILSIDYDYRKNEVLSILKNINCKYTLKLYDDRDTWEPVLSKVRALIECRQ